MVEEKFEELERKIKTIRRDLKAIHEEHTIDAIDDPANIVALVYMLAKETQTIMFMFLGKHPGRHKESFLKNRLAFKTEPQLISDYKT